MLFPRPDFPFRREDASRILPWVIAFMVYLLALCALIATSLHYSLLGWSRQYSDTLSIQISAPSESASKITRQAVGMLEATPGILEVSVKERQDVEALITPWLGNSDLLELLPVPVVLEAALAEDPRPDAPVLLEKLKSRLGEQVTVTLDDHAHWIDRFAMLVRTGEWMLLGVLVLVAVVTAAIVVLTTRTELRLHRQTLELLHLVGATPRYITKQFQWNALGLAMRGVVPGILLALVTVLVIRYVASDLDSPFLPTFAWHDMHGVALAAVVIASLAIAWVSAQVTVFRALRRMMG